MPSQRNLDLVEKFQDVIKKYPDFFVTGNKGLSVADISELRDKLRANGAVYQVIKNNLFKIALNNEGINGLDEVLVGPNAVLFAQDPVGAAKILKEYQKDKIKAEKVEVKAGFTEGQVVDKKYVDALASLPSKEELLSKLLGTLLNPMNRLVRVLNNPMQKAVLALKAIAEKK